MALYSSQMKEIKANVANTCKPFENITLSSELFLKTMKFIILSIVILVSALHGSTEAVCHHNVTSEEYLDYQFLYATPLFKHMAAKTNYHFVVTPTSIRLALAAIAEGSEGPVKEKLFRALKLPQDSCVRRKIYDIAIKNEPTANNLQLASKRTLVLDEPHNLNSTWAEDVKNIISTKVAPLSTVPTGTELLRDILSPKPTISSVIISKLEGDKGIGSETFANAKIERNAPFYDDAGNKIGTVNLMRMRRRIYVLDMPALNMKLGTLPVGKNGRYNFLFLVLTGNTTIKDAITVFRDEKTTVVTEMIANFKETAKPIEIAIPNFTIRTDTTFVKEKLEEIGVRSLWQDAEASKYVSKPAPLPGAFIQQVRLTVGRDDLEPYEPTRTEDSESFILNRPFMMALMEGASNSLVFSGIYSRPH